MKISVLIPTYRRPQELANCLTALKGQTFMPHEILIVVRNNDAATHAMLQTYTQESLPLQVVNINIGGQVAALNAGLAAATCDIIAITDDDAEPHPDWLERIHAHFLRDDTVGGVGGRDWTYIDGQLQTAQQTGGNSGTIGRLQWFGRMIGNHHLGEGYMRSVDILKGANMSYRRHAISNLRFNENLRGTGAQVDNEVDFCLKLKKRGWQLIYDPQVAVDHFPAQRFDEDQRSTFNRLAQYNTSHNETYAILNNISLLSKVFFLLWAFVIGTRRTPGFLQILRLFPSQGILSFDRGLVSIQGRIAGIKSWLTVSS
jgi:cellulose synthase/poly-beta-1,6-N-acetylglucosamine synthase-like glycosyltransferase